MGDGEDRHVTAESLYALSANSGEKVSLATVYNTLRAFCEAGLMNEVVVDGSKSYFDTRTDDHPHFYWEDSQTLTDAPAEGLEIARLPHDIVQCFYGEDEDDSTCPQLAGSGIEVIRTSGGHHFDGDYAGLATVILEALPKP